jgi:hypothetical protein
MLLIPNHKYANMILFTEQIKYEHSHLSKNYF